VPLFRLPDGSSAAEVHQAFMRSLAEHRVQLSQRIGEIGRELTVLAIEGRGRAAIVRRAGQLADVVMALEDELGRALVVYAPPGGRIDRAEVGRLLAELRASAPSADGADELRRHEELLVGQRVGPPAPPLPLGAASRGAPAERVGQGQGKSAVPMGAGSRSFPGRGSASERAPALLVPVG